MATKFSENSEENNAMFYCKKCDYLCFKLQHYKQHAMTKKHKCNIFNNVENSVNQTENEKLKCVCGKVYRDRSGLWRHKKICVVKEELEEIEETEEKIEITPNTQLTPELIIKLIEQNKELQQALIDQNKKIVFRTRDANSSINIMKLTQSWIENQERPLCFQISSFTSPSKNNEDEKVRPS